MYYLAQVCRACIKNDGKLIKIHDLDVDNVSFYEKLILCLPKMIFEESTMRTYLCQNCINILRKMYDFRELCINSERILKRYILQLEQASSLKHSNKTYLKELMDNNYADITTIRKESMKLTKLKLENFDSELDTEVIKTETLNFEYIDVERLETNCLLDIKDEPVEIKPDCQDYIVIPECTVEQDNYMESNKDSSIQSPNISETSRSKHEIEQQRIVNSEKPLKCYLCSSRFTYLSQLHRHELIHTGSKFYECDVCSKSFSQSSYLKKHKRLHTLEKTYVCDVCSKSFHQSSYLQKHKQIHSGGKTYVCNICSKCFSRSCDLQRHKRIHTGEKPYECEVCYTSFNQIVHLRTHTRIHTGEKSYKCNVCSKRFTRLDNLHTHKRIHTCE